MDLPQPPQGIFHKTFNFHKKLTNEVMFRYRITEYYR